MRALRTLLLTFMAARPGSGPTIGIVTVAIIALCVVSYRSGTKGRIGGVSLTILRRLTAMNCLLGMASYWDCHDPAHPVFITAVVWTARLIKGGNSDLNLASRICTAPIPL